MHQIRQYNWYVSQLSIIAKTKCLNNQSFSSSFYTAFIYIWVLYLILSYNLNISSEILHIYTFIGKSEKKEKNNGKEMMTKQNLKSTKDFPLSCNVVGIFSKLPTNSHIKTQRHVVNYKCSALT